MGDVKKLFVSNQVNIPFTTYIAQRYAESFGRQLKVDIVCNFNVRSTRIDLNSSPVHLTHCCFWKMASGQRETLVPSSGHQSIKGIESKLGRFSFTVVHLNLLFSVAACSVSEQRIHSQIKGSPIQTLWYWVQSRYATYHASEFALAYT